MGEMDVPGMTPVPGVHASASEDFFFVAQRVPSTFMYLSAGYEDERGEHPAHDPRVRFNEEVLPIGALQMPRMILVMALPAAVGVWVAGVVSIVGLLVVLLVVRPQLRAAEAKES